MDDRQRHNAELDATQDAEEQSHENPHAADDRHSMRDTHCAIHDSAAGKIHQMPWKSRLKPETRA
jgi:hypothetical protein